MMYFHQQKGFSLVETLVAISIVLLVIVGPLTFSSRAAKSSSFASEQVQAFFLAQEGLELAQAARDELVLRSFLPALDVRYVSNPWTRFTATSGANAPYQDCYVTTGCGLTWSALVPTALATPVACGTGTTCLLLDVSNGRSRYTHGGLGDTPTLFTRRIYFSPPGPNREVYVRSEVTWRTGSILATQRVEVTSYLYNVYDKP